MDPEATVSKPESAAAVAPSAAVDPAAPAPTLEEGSDTEAVAPSRDHLVVISWSLKKGKLDTDRVANILGESDLALVPSDAQLNVIAQLIGHKINENVCVGWFRDEKNVRGPIGLLWRESQLALVDSDGTMRPTCASHPWPLRTHDQQLSTAQFLHRGTGRMLRVDRVLFPRTPKTREVSEVFRSSRDLGWPTLVAGDFKLPPKNVAFKQAHEWHYQAATKTQSETLWSHNLSLVGSEPVRLHTRFPEVSASYIKNNLGDSLPLRAEYSFNDDESSAGRPVLLTKHAKSSKPKHKSTVQAKTVAYPAATAPENLNEDLAAEADQASTKDREPNAAPLKKSLKKKKTKKKKHAH